MDADLLPVPLERACIGKGKVAAKREVAPKVLRYTIGWGSSQDGTYVQLRCQLALLEPTILFGC